MLNLVIYNPDELYFFKIDKDKQKSILLTKTKKANKRKAKKKKKNLESEAETPNLSEKSAQENDQDPKENLEKVMAKMTRYSVQEIPNIHRLKSSADQLNPLLFTCDYEFSKNEIIFTREGVKFFRFDIKKVLYQHFGIKLVIYNFNKQTQSKELLMEISAQPDVLVKFKEDLLKRNQNKSRDHPLSLKFESKESESPFSDQSSVLNLRGFLNLFILYSLLNYSRLIIEHTMNYKQVFWDSWNILFPDTALHQIVLIVLSYPVVLVAVYYLQIFAMRRVELGKRVDLAVVLILSLFFLVCSWMVYIFDLSIFINLFVNGSTISVLFKAISFSHVCHQIRQISKSMNEQPINTMKYEEIFQENELSKDNFLLILSSKDNLEKLINLQHCVYYFFLPTFDFKLKYTRKKKIDKIYLIKRMTETVVLWGLFFFMIAHFVLPILQQADEVFIKDTHFLEKLTFFVRLALACTATWIVMFIAVFHGYCQSVAELLRYSDRCFYQDWWNSRNLSQYWRTWNLPIHSFFMRHISNPLTSCGLNRHAINSIVFIISAIFHEYIISLSLKKFCTWTLLSFSMQYFYIVFEKMYMKYFNLEKTNYGNYMFWGLFCVYGQPTLLLQYYFYIKYRQNFSLWPF